jgi:two-component system, NarL family, response regulator NreC
VRPSDGPMPDPETEHGPPVRVVLADDHSLMRYGLRRVLDGESAVAVVAEADNLADMVREVLALRPQVLLIDLNMANGSSIDTIRLLRIEAPGTAIIVLAMEESAVFARAALDAGATGFVLKQAAEADLAEAVMMAARGELYLSPRLAVGLDALGSRSP